MYLIKQVGDKWLHSKKGRKHEEHGKAGTRTYRIWSGVLQRCLNKDNPSYEDYGAKGITVCDRWKTSFLNFINDMGECPQGYSLDRIDGSGNYEPSNCRWADDRTQMLNRSSTVWIEYLGDKLCLSDWARRFNMNADTIRRRMKKGLAPELIFEGRR